MLGPAQPGDSEHGLTARPPLVSFTLPEDAGADNTLAEPKDGVLSIRVLKAPGTRAKKVALGAGKGKAATANRSSLRMYVQSCARSRRSAADRRMRCS